MCVSHEARTVCVCMCHMRLGRCENVSHEARTVCVCVCVCHMRLGRCVCVCRMSCQHQPYEYRAAI